MPMICTHNLIFKNIDKYLYAVLCVQIRVPAPASPVWSFTTARRSLLYHTGMVLLYGVVEHAEALLFPY